MSKLPVVFRWSMTPLGSQASRIAEVFNFALANNSLPTDYLEDLEAVYFEIREQLDSMK